MVGKKKNNTTFYFLAILLLGIIFGLGFLCGKASNENQGAFFSKLAGREVPTVEIWKEEKANYKNKNEIRKININNASFNELIEINNIDEATAKKIIAFREEFGGFNELRELVRLGLISQSRADSIKDYVSVEFP